MEQPSFSNQPKNTPNKADEIKYESFLDGIDNQFGFEMSREQRNGGMQIQESKFDSVMDGSSVFERTDPKVDEQRK